MTTLFLRLLAAEEKASALVGAVAATREGRASDGVVHAADPVTGCSRFPRLGVHWSQSLGADLSKLAANRTEIFWNDRNLVAMLVVPLLIS